MFKDIVSLFKQTIAFGTGEALIKSIGIVLIPIYTHILTLSDYGVLGTLAPVSAILIYIYAFGLNGAVMRYEVELENDEERRIAHGTAWLFLMLMAGGITVLLILFGQYFWSHLFRHIPYFPFALLVIGTAALETTCIVPMALLKIRGKAITFSCIGVIKFIITTTLIIVMIVVFRLGAKGQLMACLISAFIFAIVYVAITLRDIKINLNVNYLKKYLAFGLPFIPSGLSLWILSLSNILILQRLRSLEEVGLFALGFKFGVILELFVTAVITAWQPFFFKKGNLEKAPELFAQIGTYFLLIIMGVGVAIVLGAQQVLQLLTPPEFHGAGSVVGLVVCGIIIRGVYLFDVQAIAFKMKTTYLPFIDGTAAVMNVILSFLLIPKYGIIGAAFSVMTAYSVQLVGGFVVTKSLYPITYQYSRLIRIVVVYVFVFAGLWHLELGSHVWTLIARLGLLPILVLIGLFILRVPEDREIQKLFDIFQQIRRRFSVVS